MSSTNIHGECDHLQEMGIIESLSSGPEPANMSLKRYRWKVNKWTRWDVIDLNHCDNGEIREYNGNLVSSVEVDNVDIELAHQEGPSEENVENSLQHLNNETKDDDDEELQSDDDVVGPWHEDSAPNLPNNVELMNADAERQNETLSQMEPDSNNKSFPDVSKPDPANIRQHNLEINSQADVRMNGDMDDNRFAMKEPVLPLPPKIAAAKRKTASANRQLQVIDRVTARKATTKPKAKPLHPPTKSSFARKTDKKMRQQQTAAKGKKGKKKTKKTKVTAPPQEEFSTTGAFLTRGTAKQLAGPHGFQPNTFNYHYLQSVEVLNINGCWYSGILMEMNSGKVKVKYTDWKEHEWIIIGSRRLRPVALNSCGDDIGFDESQEDAQFSGSNAQTTHLHCDNEIGMDGINGVQCRLPANFTDDSSCPAQCLPEAKVTVETQQECELLTLEQSGDTVINPDSVGSDETSNETSNERAVSGAAPAKKRTAEPVIHEYRTTGAFATRNALRELADPHGFTPNAYG